MNIEHPTSPQWNRKKVSRGKNVEWKTRIKILLYFRVIWGAKRYHYSTFNVQCSMLDVHFFNSMFIFFSPYSAKNNLGLKLQDPEPLNPTLKPGCGSSFTKQNFTGCVFGYMFFKFVAPEWQKSSAASIQSVDLCKVGILTAQIAPFDVMGCDTGVFFHIKPG